MSIMREKATSLNNSVNIMRLMCAYLVVAIHTNPLSDINQQVGFFISEVITRIAVPFFFIVSGYYYCQKVKADRKYFKYYIKNLLPNYCMWALIYFIVNLFQAIFGDYFSIKSYIVDCVIRFLLYGPYYHLWFVPALIIAALFVTFAEKIKARRILFCLSFAAYFVGVFSSAYYKIGINLIGIGALYQVQGFETIRRIFLMGVPFFVAGYVIPYLSEKISRSGIWITFFGFLNIVEIYLVSWKEWSNGVVLTFALYPLTLLTLTFCIQHPMEKLKPTVWQSRASKFIYFSHPLFLIVYRNILPMTSTMAFLIVSLTCTMVSIVILKAKQPYLLMLM